MKAAEQSSGEWLLWRPPLFTRVAMPRVVVPSVVYVIVKGVAGLIRDPTIGTLIDARPSRMTIKGDSGPTPRPFHPPASGRQVG